MFLSLMLVGYATSKFADKNTASAPWYANLFEKKPVVTQAPVNDESGWDLGAEAWVSIPPQPARGR